MDKQRMLILVSKNSAEARSLGKWVLAPNWQSKTIVRSFAN